MLEDYMCQGKKTHAHFVKTLHGDSSKKGEDGSKIKKETIAKKKKKVTGGFNDRHTKIATAHR